jgi:hypothetical protein
MRTTGKAGALKRHTDTKGGLREEIIASVSDERSGDLTVRAPRFGAGLYHGYGYCYGYCYGYGYGYGYGYC